MPLIRRSIKFCVLATDSASSVGGDMKGRYFCFTVVIRVNQIEVSPGVNLGVDETRENTLENLVRYRESVYKADPSARITFALSDAALREESLQFRQIRSKLREYHDRYGDDITYMLGAYFSAAYVGRREICENVHKAILLLREFMGKEYRPKCIVGGFIAAEVIRYIADCENIHVVQGNIFSQYAVDNQDGDGSICYPYYPSKEHFCKPAQSKEDFIDCVNLDGWTVDFVNATYSGLTKEEYNSRMGCGPIETLRPFGVEKGLRIMLASADQMLGENYERNGGFGYAAAIWELCLIQKDGHHRMNIDESVITEFFKRLKSKYSDLQILPFGEVGERFRSLHKDNSRLSYVFVHRGTGDGGSLRNIRLYWYMNKYFRLCIRENLTEGKKEVIDFTDYTKTYKEPEDSDYRIGKVCRNWSLLGDINQKGLRPQDVPVPFEKLSEYQKALIRKAESEFGFTVSHEI